MFKRRHRAGTYTEERYRLGLRSWRAKNRRLFLALCGPFIVVGVVVGILSGDVIAWSAGMAAGAFAVVWSVLRETPPWYVEKWRDGTEGERKTERALRPLERVGWHVVHDIQNGYGNYDHIAVGPTGVYLLETKNLQGIVEVKGGVPHLVRRHDPEENMAFDRIRPCALTDAVRVKKDIERRTGHRVWVQAVVVFWSEFPEGFFEDEKCLFIDGSRLRDLLQSRPRRLGQDAVEEIAGGIESIAEDAAAADTDVVPPELSPA